MQHFILKVPPIERSWASGPPIDMKVTAPSPPRKRGARSLDSRLRGNDVTFDRAQFRLNPEGVEIE